MPLVTRPAERLPKDYIALDLETTGLSAQRDRITEIGAVKIRDGRIADRYAQLVNPGVLISPRITQITGITNAMVEHQPAIEDVLEDFIDFLGDDTVSYTHLTLPTIGG